MAAASPLVGSLAPDFSLPCTSVGSGGPRTASLADYRGRWLMLLFYPRDFSLVCPTELTALSARLDEFQRRGCELLGVSTDSIETHERWIATPKGQQGLGGLAFPLAADEAGAAARAYGVYLEWQKLALRGLFIIDPNGVLQYAVVHNTSVGRRTDEILRVVDALQSGGLCPENWTAGAPTIDPAQAVGPGTVLAHYRFEEKLGSGSFASVFRARDLTLERPVAIKVLQPQKLTSPAVVLAEARAAAALNHPHICTIFSVDDSEGVPLIVMEYVAGRSLAAHLEEGAFEPARAGHVVRQAALGMAAAHAAGIVHGDLKPENLLITDEGLVKITDFGLARRDLKTEPTAKTATWLGQPEGLSGTPAYMAPEMVAGAQPTPASDVFALGLVFYELLTGRKAVQGDNVLKVFQGLRELQPDRLAAEVPERWQALFKRMLAEDPRQRPGMSPVVAELAQG
ncbi:MAG: protein kinase domain-containing protein [Planctomycetaceae bacterium]